LIRASIPLREKIVLKKMDQRVNDDDLNWYDGSATELSLAVGGFALFAPRNDGRIFAFAKPLPNAIVTCQRHSHP